MPACKSCGAAIDWITSKRGAPMPVDAKPLKVVTREGQTIDGFISHFSTCPHAVQHRKRAPGATTEGSAS